MPRRNHPKSGRRPQNPKTRKPPKRRNLIALGASMKKATKFKDRRVPRGGAKNEQREFLKEADDTGED